jgi:hypothetical protein
MQEMILVARAGHPPARLILDTELPHDTDCETRLLAQLPHCRLLGRLARLDTSSRDDR